MKNPTSKILAIFLFFSLLSTTVTFGQIDLSGKWTAHCIMEKTDQSSISFCDFCPYFFDADKSMLNFADFGMDFEDEQFTLIIDGDSQKVAYKADEQLQILEFKYKEKSYKFNILTVINSENNNYILKDSEGMLIMLRKK